MNTLALYKHYFTRFQQYFFKYRNIPSIQKCADIIGVTSHTELYNFYSKMIEQGYIQEQENHYIPTKKLRSLPIYSSVHAGIPFHATDDHQEQLSLEEYLIPNPASTIYVKVKGDSMIDASIAPGDAVIVEKGAEAKSGDIVIAVVDHEYTLKYLMKENGICFLQAANKNYDDIYPGESLEIFGVVRGSFRKYN